MNRVFRRFQMQSHIEHEVVANRALEHGWQIPSDIQPVFGLTIENPPFWVATYWPQNGDLRITFYDGVKDGDEIGIANHIIEVLEGRWRGQSA